MELIINEGTEMMKKIRPWFIMDKERYSNPRLRPDTPIEIVELYEKFKVWREEYNRIHESSLDW